MDALLHLRGQPPGILEPVVGLDHLNDKWEVCHDVSEEICTGCWFNGSVQFLEDDPCCHIYGSILVVRATMACFDVFGVHLDFFTWHVASADGTWNFFSMVCAFSNTPRALEGVVDP